MSKAQGVDPLKRLSFYWETVRCLGVSHFTGEVKQKLWNEFRYRHFISFAQKAPGDYSPDFALNWMARSDLTRVVKDIRSRRFPLFFLDSSRREDYRGCLESQGVLEPFLEKADRITQGALSVFTHELCWNSSDFDWHTDPLSGWRWEAKGSFYLREKMSSEVVAPPPGDVRVVWEMSRLGCLVRLGQAWWLTGSEKYIQSLVRILDHWLDHNQPYRGVNWSLAMEVAIRAVNVIWAFFLVIDSPLITDELVGKVLSFLILSRQFILGKLERYYRSSGNHYISNLVGLIYIDLLFPELSRFSQADFAMRELSNELENQVYSDGVHFENSTAYHGFVLEMFLSTAILCRENGRPLSKRFLAKIAQMAAFIRDALPPSGRMMQIGDNDSGRLLELGDDDPLDHSRWCDLAAVFTHNPGLASPNRPSTEILWYMGPETYRACLTASPSKHSFRSSAFVNAGLYFMKSDKGWMSISCGPNGLYDRGAHAHNDKLSFELWYRGEGFLVDPGSGVYSGDPELRNRFRSTAYHNTVIVDGEEQNRFSEDIFFLHNDSLAEVQTWESCGEYDFFSGVHYGYRRLSCPVVHRRQIRFDKRELFWRVVDNFEGEGQHCLEWNFHLAPEIDAEIVNAKTFRLTGKRNILVIQFEEPAELQIKEGLFSAGYRQQQPTKVVQRKITKKIPYRTSFELKGLEVEGGRGE